MIRYQAMEKGPKIIDFVGKKKERTEKIEAGKYYEKGKFYEFKRAVRVEVIPKGDEVGEGANIPVPAELPPGKYECLGFDEKGCAYKFRGKPVGEDKESELLIDIGTIVEG